MFGKMKNKKNAKDAMMKNKIEASREVGVPSDMDNQVSQAPGKFKPSKESVANLNKELSKNKVETAMEVSFKTKNNQDNYKLTPEEEKYHLENRNRIM